MGLPQVNKQYFQFLREKAEEKLRHFEEKIANINAHIVALKEERESAKVILEYFSLSEARKKLLLDLFFVSGEYGTTEEISKDYIQQLEKHIEHMDSSISSYEQRKDRRIKGIQFLKEDITRLKKIEHIHFRQEIFFARGIDD